MPRGRPIHARSDVNYHRLKATASEASDTATRSLNAPRPAPGPEIESPVMHDHRRRNIPVEIGTAVAAVSEASAFARREP